jgi:SH3-like domain-containing protein
MKTFILLAITTAILVSAVFSQEKVKAVKSCDIKGYVLDNDPNGLNVRATPDKSGKILRSLIKDEDEILLDITAASGKGWVKITNVWRSDDDDLFKGTGWVFATMLATITKGYPNYDSPAKLYPSMSKKGKFLKQIPSESEVTILDCHGSWAKVSYKGTSGWLAPENQCGNPLTTCN